MDTFILLKQLRPKKQEIRRLWDAIENINTQLENCTSKLTDTPHSTAERYVTEMLLDKKTKHLERIRFLEESCAEADAIIEECEDVLTRLWMELHFVDGLSWGQSAARSGSGITGNGARMCVVRYCKRMDDDTGRYL